MHTELDDTVKNIHWQNENLKFMFIWPCKKDLKCSYESAAKGNNYDDIVCIF